MSLKGLKRKVGSNISESIFMRWCEKMQSEKEIPDILVETIQKLHNEGKLKDSNEILKIMSKLENLGKHED